jgi:hypothetical protein
MNHNPAPISAHTWKRHLLYAEDYFLFPTGSRVPLPSPAAFRFAATGRTLVVRSKSGATYTGPNLRALLIRITDSGMLDDYERSEGHDLEYDGHDDGGHVDGGGRRRTHHHTGSYDEEQLFLGSACNHEYGYGYGYERQERQGRFLPAELDTGTCILEF